MLETTIDEKQRREGLKAKRDLLFEEYLQHPLDTRLALGSEVIGDQLVQEFKTECGKERSRKSRKLSSVSGRAPGPIGIRRKRKTEKSRIASFATERPNKEQGQKYRFADSFTSGLVDSYAGAQRTTHHPGSPKTSLLLTRFRLSPRATLKTVTF